MDKLQQNLKESLFQTLMCLASRDEQLAYKKAVPYVHIPYELICQWDAVFIKEDHTLFRQIWTDTQWTDLEKYNTVFNNICEQIHDTDFDDIPEVLDHPLWAEIIIKSNDLLTKLKADSQPK